MLLLETLTLNSKFSPGKACKCVSWGLRSILKFMLKKPFPHECAGVEQRRQGSMFPKPVKHSGKGSCIIYRADNVQTKIGSF